MQRRVSPYLVVLGISAALTMGPSAVGSAAPAVPGEPGSGRVTWDDFHNGFDHAGDDAKWALSPTGSLPDGDGKTTTSSDGLNVVPTATNTKTGKPAFAYTTGKEADGGQGAYDHLKWYALTNHQSSSGFKGFDAQDGRVLTFDTTMSARTFGTEEHPFGDAVDNPRIDLRLAAGAMTTIDQESNMVFDFFITNGWVYVLYERLPKQGADYAAFTYAKPVERRISPDQDHDLAISYDKSAGTVTWSIDGREVYKVDKIGYKPADREDLIIDLGGREELVEPRQLAAGIGMFTLLDADGPDTSAKQSKGADHGALVKLTDTTPYYDPDSGEPAPQRFTDDKSLAANRLWGQGAQLDVAQLSVENAERPAR